MLYAQVVFGLPVEGPFDYIVPKNYFKKISVGGRVWAPFGARKAVGYVVGLSRKTKIARLKEIGEVVDERPVLDKNILKLTRQVSQYYCCSWGEAIESALPRFLRKGKVISAFSSLPPCGEVSPIVADPPLESASLKPAAMLLHDPDFTRRWEVYLKEIQSSLDRRRTSIILLPDIESIERAKELIAAKISAGIAVLYADNPQGDKEWLRARLGEAKVILGSRSGIFAPAVNLGLVIIEAEEDPVYKQEQVPHYHTRETAFMRMENELANLVLGSASPSLESYLLAKRNKIKYCFGAPRQALPQVKVVDTQSFRQFRKKGADILSRYLEDAVASGLAGKLKTLLLLNRKGFATAASCNTCGSGLKCPRCGISLVFYFRESVLSCRYCNFKIPAPKICPRCNAGYIRYSGLGTQKLESELCRIFPQAKISRFERAGDLSSPQADIIVATSVIMKDTRRRFDLIGVLGIDNSLNRVDLRAAEKTFGLLTGLLQMAKAGLVIQTGIPHYHVFRAIKENDSGIFYEQELKTRRQLGFPPFKHLGLVRLRGRNEEKVEKTAAALCGFLSERNRKKGLQINACSPGLPPKLRDNFYWQVLLASRSPMEISEFLKINLKDFPHSGIIMTVDIDPL